MSTSRDRSTGRRGLVVVSLRLSLFNRTTAMNSLGIMIGQKVKVPCVLYKDGETIPTTRPGIVYAWSNDGELYLVRMKDFGWMWFKTEQLKVQRSLKFVTVNMN